MPYIGKKPADIIATVIDTTTGTFSGEVDAGSLDVSGNADIDGITNLDNTDIDGTLDVSGNLTVDTNTLYVDSANNRVGVGTVSPSDLLELSGSTAQPAIRLNDTDVSGLYHRIFTPTNTGLAISADTGNVASDSFLRFDVDGSERMRIDSSGFISLAGDTDTGWSLPTANQQQWTCGGALTFKTYQIAGAYGILSVNGSGSATYPNFTFNGDDNTGMFRATTDILAFTTGGSEAMRIDGSQNLLVGGTNSTPHNLTSGGGFSVRGSINLLSVARQDNEAMILNRTGTDGDIALFRKNGSNVGSIGNNGTELFIGTPSGSGGYIRLQSGGIVPATSTGANSDGTMQIGTASGRFTDLYLSNSVRLKGATRDISIQQDNYGLRVYDNDASSERFRIDASGNVGINDSGPEAKLHISENASGATYPILLQNRTNSNSSVGIRFIATGSDLSDGQFASIEAIGDTAGNTRHHLAFKTVTSGGTPAERMRITDGGNFLVGTTDTNVLANRGFAAKPQGSNNVRVDIGSNYQAMLLSTQNDGDIVGFYKDSTIVGSIGVNGGDVYFSNGTAGIKVFDSEIRPVNGVGNGLDSTVDLGSGSSGKFKDLFLSGGVYLGGTGSANYLDDYEEGAHIITFPNSSASPSGAGAVYTKIGSVVNYVGSFTFPSSSDSTAVNISIPFTSASNNSIGQIFTNSVTNKVLFTGGAGTNYMRIYPDNSFGTNSYADLSGVAIYFTITYRTSA